MIVNHQKPIELLNLCGATYDEDELVNAILWLAGLYGKPVQRLKRIFLYGRYPAISIYGDKLHLHRLLGMYWWRDTNPEFDAMYIHHRNHNKLDARRSNLELIDVTEHQHTHNAGRVFTPEHRARIGEANRRRWLPEYQRIGIYENPELLKGAA